MFFILKYCFSVISYLVLDIQCVSKFLTPSSIKSNDANILKLIEINNSLENYLNRVVIVKKKKKIHFKNFDTMLMLLISFLQVNLSTVLCSRF